MSPTGGVSGHHGAHGRRDSDGLRQCHGRQRCDPDRQSARPGVNGRKTHCVPAGPAHDRRAGSARWKRERIATISGSRQEHRATSSAAINRLVTEGMNTPQMVQRLALEGSEPAERLTPQELRATLDRDRPGGRTLGDCARPEAALGRAHLINRGQILEDDYESVRHSRCQGKHPSFAVPAAAMPDQKLEPPRGVDRQRDRGGGFRPNQRSAPRTTPAVE